MKFTLPVYSEGDIVDRTTINLDKEYIQEILDIICEMYEGGQDDARLKLLAEDSGIVDVEQVKWVDCED